MATATLRLFNEIRNRVTVTVNDRSNQMPSKDDLAAERTHEFEQAVKEAHRLGVDAPQIPQLELRQKIHEKEQKDERERGRSEL